MVVIVVVVIGCGDCGGGVFLFCFNHTVFTLIRV